MGIYGFILGFIHTYPYIYTHTHIYIHTTHHLRSYISAGEMTSEELERLITIVQNPTEYKIPDWFLNRQKDIKTGKYAQLVSNNLDNMMREDMERMKKMRLHRGLRHYWGLRVRGQHTKTTGRRGRTVGVSKKKSTRQRGGFG